MTTANLDLDIRHYIYTRFAEKALPPITRETAAHFGISIAEAEAAYTRLAEAHQIALAPGTHSVWMAHPHSSIPTNFLATVGAKEYWANCAWDVFGIAVILGKAAVAHAPCGCGNCNERFDLAVTPGQALTDSDWLVHFLVPARKFWDDVGYT